MPTIFYPDIASYQAGISLKGTVACCAKATEGQTYRNPDYSRAAANAATHGVFFWAYHFLHHGNAAAQADHCFSVTGKTPLMLDFEETPSTHPNVTDAVAFIDRYRARGGVCNFVYLPEWYWNKIGRPSLQPLISRGLKLVSSHYTGYSDSGIGWQAYGGWTPTIWQFSSSFLFNGQRVDFNAFKGTVDQLRNLAGGTAVAPKPEDLILRRGDKGPAVLYAQKRLNAHGSGIKEDGDFGPITELAVTGFQVKVFGQGPQVDGIIGPNTWAALDAAPGSGNPPAGHWTFRQVRAFKCVGSVQDAAAFEITSPSGGFLGDPPPNKPGIDHYDLAIVDRNQRTIKRVDVRKGNPTQTVQVNDLPKGQHLGAWIRAQLADRSHSAPWVKIDFWTVA